MNDDPEQRENASACIRWCPSEPGPCVVCQGPVGTGPVGFRSQPEPGPLCDPCLADAQPGLGRLLLATNAIRELADGPVADPRARRHRLIVLALLTKLYHRLESRVWPTRGEVLADFLEQMTAASVDVPLETAVMLADELVDDALLNPPTGSES